MIGTLVYRDETVVVIDVIWSTVKNRNEYLIAYGSPTWVSEDEVSNVVYLAA
jgi:hypothetical protein